MPWIICPDSAGDAETDPERILGQWFRTFSLSTWFMFFLFVEHLGERALAITNIIRNVSGIPFMVTMAFAATCGSLVSNLIGAGEIKCVPERSASTSVSVIFSCCRWLYSFALFPNLILSIYTDIPDLREASIPSLWVLCSAYLILVPANVYFQAVSGTATHVRRWDWNSVYWPFIWSISLIWFSIWRVDVAVCWTTEHL